MKLSIKIFIFLSVFIPTLSSAYSETDKIKVGFILPLSGPLSFFGIDIGNAVKLATEQNTEILKYTEILYEDSAYDGKQSIAAFNKLVDQSNVDLIYSFGGPMLNVLAPIAETRSIPFFATESETKDCENRKFCSLFRNSADEWGQAVWQMLRAKEQKKIGIVKNQNQFMNTFVDAIIRNKNAEEIVEIWIDVPADVSDFRTSVLNLKNKNFDALGVFLLPNSHRAMLNALNNVNSRVQMFGVEEFLVKENNKGLEKLVEDTLIFTPAVSKKFNTDFTSRHGETAGYFYAVAAYDFMNLLAETIKNNPNLRKLELIKALHFKDQRIGEGGSYKLKFSKENVPFYSFPIAVHQLKSGKAVIVREIEF